jgi:hypothetical protein
VLLIEWREVEMARGKATAKMIEKMQLALFLEANTNEKQPELLAAMLQKLLDADPESADAELERIIDFIVGAMPEDKRQKFLEELQAFMQPN